MRESLNFGMLNARKPHRPYVGLGSQAEVQRGPRNVRFWGWSGSRFRASGGPLIANSRLTPLLEGGRHRAHRDAGGGSRPQHQEETFEPQGRQGKGRGDCPERLGCPWRLGEVLGALSRSGLDSYPIDRRNGFALHLLVLKKGNADTAFSPQRDEPFQLYPVCIGQAIQLDSRIKTMAALLKPENEGGHGPGRFAKDF